MKKEDDSDLNKRGAMGDPFDGTVPVAVKQPLSRMSKAFGDGFLMAIAPKPPNPLRTGFPDLDKGLRRMGPGEVTMLAADSGIGKSTLVTQMALHTAACGHGVVYLNLEMSTEMYGLRTVANFMRLPTGKTAAGELDDEQAARFKDGFSTLLEPAHRIVMGNASEHRTIPSIKKLVAEAARDLEAEGTPLKLVVVDHILQVLVSVKNDKDAEGKARADLLKELATTYGVHVIALVHVTREGSKEGKMPTKNQLASSAWFDRHPDNILVFHQKRAPDGTFAKEAKAMLACQKSRWGEPFAVELEYQGGFFYPWGLLPRGGQ